MAYTKKEKQNIIRYAKKLSKGHTFTETLQVLNSIYDVPKSTLSRWSRKYNIEYRQKIAGVDRKGVVEQATKRLEQDIILLNSETQNSKGNDNRTIDTLITKYYLKGYTTKEIATTLNISKGKVEYRLYRKKGNGKSLFDKIQEKRNSQLNSIINVNVNEVFEKLKDNIHIDNEMMKMKKALLSEVAQYFLQSKNEGMKPGNLEKLQKFIKDIQEIDTSKNRKHSIELLNKMGLLDTDKINIQNINENTNSQVEVTDFINFVIDEDN